MHQQNQLTQASRLYAQLLQDQPEHEELLHLYAILSSQLGHYDIAIPLMEKILSHYPQIAALYLNLGHAYHSDGQQSKAYACYLKALELEPTLTEAHNNLAGLQIKMGQWLEAKSHLEIALAQRPTYPEAWYHLGLWHEHHADCVSAQQAYQQAVQCLSSFAKAWNRLGILAQQLQNWQQAEYCYQQALHSHPDDAEVYSNWGVLLQEQGDYAAAQLKLERAIQLHPDYPEAWYNLGYVAQLQDDSGAAQQAYEKALALCPGYAQAWYNVGLLQQKQGEPLLAIASLQQALSLHFRSADVCYHLGVLFQEIEDLPQSEAFLDRAILAYQEQQVSRADFSPDVSLALGRALKARQRYAEARACFEMGLPEPEARCELAHTLYLLKEYDQAWPRLQEVVQQGYESSQIYAALAHIALMCGDIQANIDYLKKAMLLAPRDADANLMLLFSLHGKPGITPTVLASFYQQWEERHIQKLYPHQPIFSQPRDPHRRLRIGYISADFRQHSAAAVFELLFQLHDRHFFEIVAYSNVIKKDDATDWFEQKSDQWHAVTTWSNHQLFEQIYQDNIDILVDLSGLTAGQRLAVLARKPAPIQVTGLGFGSTTGLATMDYAFTDHYLAAPEFLSLYREKLYYLRSLICWTPTREQLALPLQVPRHAVPGQIVLGCGNASFKINAVVVALWARILRQLPQAILHLKSANFEYERVKTHFIQAFEQQGIAPHRLLFSGLSNIQGHMEFYQEVDIALDPFPYNGGITTCEILWMGVPVVTLASQSLNRAGVSLLSNTGHREWIARDEDDYVAIVHELSVQPLKRQQWRTQLREDVLRSPVCDAHGFVREIESAYYQMWEQWCKQPSPLL